MLQGHTMHTGPFDANQWQRQCQAAYDLCGKRAQTPMHHMFLFSQCIDDALGDLDAAHQGLGIQIAQGFGYETTEERHAYVGWFIHHASEAALSA